MKLKVSHRLAKPLYFEFFTKFNMVLRYDSIASAFSFDFYFDPYDQRHAELFAVSHFHEAILEDNGETLLTGFILTNKFKASSKKELTSIGGYSKTGNFEDSNIPPSLYPLQVDGLSISQIANKLCEPFKVKVVIDPSVASKMNAKVKSSTFEATETIKEVLTKLCVQRKIVMTHNVYGDLVFTQAQTNKKPLFDVSTGVPGVEMELMFDGQKLHSDITVMKEANSSGGNAGQYTIENPLVPVAYTYRPRVVIQSSGDDSTLEEFAKQTLAIEIKEAIVLTIKIDRWRINEKVVLPNNTVSVYNPELFLYKTVEWFIEEVRFEGDTSKQTAILKCVLPCCYDGTTPKNIFINPRENFPRFDFTKNNTGKTAFI